jgi:hypothetical protein
MVSSGWRSSGRRAPGACGRRADALALATFAAVAAVAMGCSGDPAGDPGATQGGAGPSSAASSGTAGPGSGGASSAAGGASSAEGGGSPTEYVGVQYDFGGATTPISGLVPEVDAIADSIAASAKQTVAEIAAERAKLPYGGLDPDPDAPAQLTTYPGPPGIAASDRYTVVVEQDGAEQGSFVYKALARKTDTNREADTSWTSFSFAGSVTVHVAALGASATGCLVRPSSAAIATEFADGVCSFTLTEPRNVSVELEPNVHNPIAHPMLVFANPPEVDVPPADDPDVVYFGPGVHHLGSGVPLESGKTIYLAGGAWVEAAFLASGPVEDLTIKGRGVISGLFLDTGNQAGNKDQPGLIDIAYQSSRNVLIEGVTFVDGPRFNVRALAQYTTIHNIKVMSWWYSTDGMVGGNKSLLERNFIKVNDDAIKLFWGDTVARQNVIWQLENGGSFMMSWNIHEDTNTFHVHDNDVIHAEHYFLSPQAVFHARHAGSGTLGRYLFEDIRVENATWRLFHLVVEDNKWFDQALGHGELEQIVFRNIHAQTTYQHESLLSGFDAEHKVRNVSLQNVFVNGKCIASAEEGNVAIDPETTNAIRIMRSKDGSCHTE